MALWFVESLSICTQLHKDWNGWAIWGIQNLYAIWFIYSVVSSIPSVVIFSLIFSIMPLQDQQ